MKNTSAAELIQSFDRSDLRDLALLAHRALDELRKGDAACREFLEGKLVELQMENIAARAVKNAAP